MKFVSVDKAEFQNHYRLFAKAPRENAFDFFVHLNTEEAFTCMRVVTEQLGTLALTGGVKSLTAPILATPEDQADRLKMAIGSLVSDIIRSNEFQKTGKKKAVAPIIERVFRSGEVFERAPGFKPGLTY